MVNLTDAWDKIINLSLVNQENKCVVKLNEAIGMVLSQDIVARKNLPSFDNSALDGYALKFDYQEDGYVVCGKILAGDKCQKNIKSNECFKIMTGAKVPIGADTILKVEDSYEKDAMVFAKKLRKNDAIRKKGEEVKAGDIILNSKIILNSSHIMLLASQGIYEVEVYKKPSIAIFSSGNELKEPWELADEDEIYNANAFGISSILNENGFKSSYLGVINDNLECVIKSIESAKDFDVIICSGGASVGDADFLNEALLKLGYKNVFQRIDIKPGAPSKLYYKNKKIVFVMPGNPMAAYLCSFLLVLPFLNSKNPTKVNAILSSNIDKKQKRTEIFLGNYKDGIFYPSKKKYGSGMITPLVENNAIYISDSKEDKICEKSEICIVRIS